MKDFFKEIFYEFGLVLFYLVKAIFWAAIVVSGIYGFAYLANLIVNWLSGS